MSAHQIMQERIGKCLADPTTRENVRKDFLHTLTQVGMSSEQGSQLIDDMFASLSDKTKPLSVIEASIFEKFSQLPVGSQTLTQAIDSKLTGRAELIFSQIQDYVRDATGDVLDFGCGDGQVTKMIADSLKRQGIKVTGSDIRDYRAEHTKDIPFSLMNGSQVNANPKAFELAVLTNVMHHEAHNEIILNELDRIVRNKLVIIETVPIGRTEEAMQADKDRTFMNDYFYNRLLHNPAIDIPVPGTFETPKGWKDRFEKHGWKVTHEKDLGIDQPTIHDRHYLLVLEKDKAMSGSGDRTR